MMVAVSNGFQSPFLYGQSTDVQVVWLCQYTPTKMLTKHEIANIRLDSSVGRAPACKHEGCFTLNNIPVETQDGK